MGNVVSFFTDAMINYHLDCSNGFLIIEFLKQIVKLVVAMKYFQT